MNIMTEKQNRDIESKIVDKLEDVKNEVSGALKVVNDRQDKMESEQQGMKDQMGMIKDQLDEIKKIAEAAAQPPQPTLPQSQERASFSEVLQKSSPAVKTCTPNESSSERNRREKVMKTVEFGGRTVTLRPFFPSDIEAELNRGAKDEVEARLWAVQVFLRYEINIKSHVLATLSIEKIFPQTPEKWDTINVTFRSITEANTVYSYSLNMRNEVTVGTYIPKEWREMSKAINNIAHGLRYGEIKYKTKVKWGSADLILYKKAPGTPTWSAVHISTSLPPVDLNAVGAPQMSPASGRQGRDTSKRNRSGSESEKQRTLAKNRKVTLDSDNDCDNSAAKANPIQPAVPALGRDSSGKFISEENYCPASPAPAKQQSAFPYSSPVFKNKPASLRMNPLVQ